MTNKIPIPNFKNLDLNDLFGFWILDFDILTISVYISINFFMNFTLPLDDEDLAFGEQGPGVLVDDAQDVGAVGHRQIRIDVSAAPADLGGGGGRLVGQFGRHVVDVPADIGRAARTRDRDIY